MGKKPDLSHLCPFGCVVTACRLNSDSLAKFQPRGEEGRFMGYARDSKGYLIWFPSSRSVLVCRDVIFHDVDKIPELTVNRSGLLWDDIPLDSTTQFGSVGHCEDVLLSFDSQINVYVKYRNYQLKADMQTDQKWLKMR